MHSTDFKARVYPLQDNLLRLAYSMLRNKEEAEDVAQEIMLRLWKRKESLDELDNLKAFALKITKNLCLDKIKLRKKVVGEIENMTIISQNRNPEEILETANAVATFFDILKMLPEQQQLIVHLRNVEGLSFEEIEAITELNINVIRVTLSRARKSINEIYQRYYNNG
jgi:RNA polymerase sigma-70 factor (ECF subfamily)